MVPPDLVVPPAPPGPLVRPDPLAPKDSPEPPADPPVPPALPDLQAPWALPAPWALRDLLDLRAPLAVGGLSEQTLKRVWASLERASMRYWPAGKFDGPVVLVSAARTEQ